MDIQENKTENQKNKIIVFLKEHWVLLTICILPLIVYFGNFWGTGLSDKTDNWGTFGDYFGGIVGTILAFGAFILMKETLKAQKDEFKSATKQFEKQTEIFNQQQFETTFFNMLKVINKQQEDIKGHLSIHFKIPNGELYKEKQNDNILFNKFYLLFLKLSEFIQQYDAKSKDGRKYADILKSQLNYQVITKLAFTVKDLDNKNIKEFIEKYSFFEFLDEQSFSCLEKHNNYFDYYDKISFGKNIFYQLYVSKNPNSTEKQLKEILLNTNNNDIIYHIIHHKNITDEIIKIIYKNHKSVMIYDIIAKCTKTPIEILEQLSQDENKKVRQAAINTINLLKSQNDENN